MTNLSLQRLALPISLLLIIVGLACKPRTAEQVARAAEVAATAEKDPPQEPYFDIGVRAQSNRIPILMFHDVTEKRSRGSVWFDCSVPEFKSMMEWILSEGIKPISLDQLYAHLTNGEPVPDKAIVLTFDDNYQGFYDNALPILKKYNFPSAMFVHTNFVGSKQGRPKMSWETLQLLAKSDLVTIGSHTLSHPDDITKLSPSDQEREIVQSKQILEEKLGKPVPYFAYPDGKNDAVTQDIVRRAGYKMAFTTHNATAEESPNIYAVNRYVHTKYEKAWDDREIAFDRTPAAVVDMRLKQAPITYETEMNAGIEMAYIKGGLPSSRRSSTREGVLDFVKDAGASAGINGTFFAMASIQGTSNEMVGPCYSSNEALWVPDNDPSRLAKIRNRPMIVWGPKRIAIFPFQAQMNDPQSIKNFMPDFTDAFVAGAWIVHDGTARTKEQLLQYSARDLMDPRRRAFLGIMPDGSMVFGASKGSVATDKLAEAAAAAGVKEAIMMDSGFSTSLVYGDKVVASGHSTPETPSRPVPHAIVLTGVLAMDPNLIVIPQPDPEPKSTRHKKKRKSKEKTKVEDGNTAQTDIVVPDSSAKEDPPQEIPPVPPDP